MMGLRCTPLVNIGEILIWESSKRTPVGSGGYQPGDAGAVDTMRSVIAGAP